VFFGLAGSGMLEAGRQAGLEVAAEGFADRAYEPDGSLTPRSIPGSVIHDVEELVARASRMVREGRVRARNGADIELRVDTLCVHGDTPGADALAAALRAGLESAGVRVMPIGASERSGAAGEAAAERSEPGGVQGAPPIK
jgi:UPF0271 protein